MKSVNFIACCRAAAWRAVTRSSAARWATIASFHAMASISALETGCDTTKLHPGTASCLFACPNLRSADRRAATRVQECV